MTERPRDRLGRPLPEGHPAAWPGVPPRDDVPADVALTEADAYLRDGLPFHAHEVLEQRWRCAPAGERPLWQALAQWAAAITHAMRGNENGARAVARRAGEALAGWVGPHAAVAAAVEGHCTALQSWRLGGPLPPTPRLRGGARPA